MHYMKEAKRLSLGVMAANGIHSLNNPEFLEAHNTRIRVAAEKTEKKTEKARSQLKKKIEGVAQLRQKHGNEKILGFLLYSKEDCGIYLQYKKQSAKEPAMPKELDARRARCLEWMSRQSPTSSQNTSNDGGGGDDGDNEGGVIILIWSLIRH